MIKSLNVDLKWRKSEDCNMIYVDFEDEDIFLTHRRRYHVSVNTFMIFRRWPSFVCWPQMFILTFQSVSSHWPLTVTWPPKTGRWGDTLSPRTKESNRIIYTFLKLTLSTTNTTSPRRIVPCRSFSHKTTRVVKSYPPRMSDVRQLTFTIALYLRPFIFWAMSKTRVACM